MTKRMLIDAAHPEETRVVVLDDRHLVDFDFESATKRQLKGNIYLAKVTRVEPSLQAAFIEYGGNRHGFLAFSEIHPDYYQIPQADRAMLEEMEREAASKAAAASEAEDDRDAKEVEAGETAEITHDADEETADVVDEFARRRSRLLRSYKIQEVIKRRQILLVQVVKEERGNKGAALTTYLSLAGRYCVLMPNTPRGGGISRKIANPVDRRRLKAIAADLEVPSGMGLIIRTAGAERNKAEIKRDYEYLMRLWSEVRDTTLNSVAPSLIYEEGDLIKRALRDLYTRDIEEVLVEGEEGYKGARRLMQMLMPSRARLVKLYDDEVPLFYLHRVEDQLDKMYSPTVQLPAGGSIVIHSTEALTAIDVNSGRSTRERHIDETAVKTNLEAADEVARQLRLRDLAGLIVIDFIDMAEHRHQRAVEKRLRDALKVDRARIQMGKISQFGLMELSRQRLRPSLQELSTQICPTCSGLGVVRSTESCALQALRMVQDMGIKQEASAVRVGLPVDVGLYLLNHKREGLVRLEQRYAMQVVVAVSSELMPPTIEIEVTEKREIPVPSQAPAAVESVVAVEEAPAEVEEAPAQQQPAPVSAAPAEGGEDGDGRKRRRRRRRRRRGGEAGPASPDMAAAGEEQAGDEEQPEADEADAEARRSVPQAAPEAPFGFATMFEEPPVAKPEPEPEPEPEPDEAAATELVEAAPAEAEPVVAAVEEPVAAAPEEPAADAEAPAPKPRRPRQRRPRVKREAKSDELPLTPAETAGAPAPSEPAPTPQVAPAAELAAAPVEAAEPVGASEAPAAAPSDTGTSWPAQEVPPRPEGESLAAAAPSAEPPAASPAPAADEQKRQPEEQAELATAGEAEQPAGARQGWWSRWVR